MRTYNFGGGVPDMECFPTAAIAEAAAKAINDVGKGLANYPGRGHAGLREALAERFKNHKDMEMPGDLIEITSGAMHAIKLLVEYFIDPGDTIITGEYSYAGILAVSRHYKAQIIGIPMDSDGMRMDLLEQSLKELAQQGVTPKFIYIVSSFQNPTGIVLPQQRREKMLSLAQEYGTHIIEDDCYGDLRFEGVAIPPIRSIDDSDTVIYIGSFSKILGAGLRVGYFVAQEPLRGQIAHIRMDGGPSVLTNCILAEYMRDNLQPHVEDVIAVLKQKRAAVFESLEQNLGDGADWTRPLGGPFIWLKLPDSTDIELLHKLLREKHVTCVPGVVFHYNNEPVKYIRIAFSYPSLDEIREGIPVLAQVIREAAGQGVPCESLQP